MPGYGAGSKRPGRGEKEAEWRRFHALQAPGNSHCAPTAFFISRSIGSKAEEVPGAQKGGQRRWRTAGSRRSGRVHEGPPPARMPVYGMGSKYLGRTEKETEWL